MFATVDFNHYSAFHLSLLAFLPRSHHTFRSYENNLSIPPSYSVSHTEFISKEQPDMKNNVLPESLLFQPPNYLKTVLKPQMKNTD